MSLSIYVDYKGQFKQIGFQLWHLFHSFVRSFCTARWEHYCLYIHCLADWIENWNSSQSETQFYASGSAFEFSNTNMKERESDQWDRKSVFQIDIDSVYSPSPEFWMKQFFFQPKRFGNWFHQIWLAEKLDRDWNLWTWFGKTYFVEINLSSVKGSGFEILINWLSALAVVGNSWANFFIKKSEASLNSSGERWQKQFLSGWRGQIQDLHSCASFQNTNTKYN